jgi:hypothetical protein
MNWPEWKLKAMMAPARAVSVPALVPPPMASVLALACRVLPDPRVNVLIDEVATGVPPPTAVNDVFAAIARVAPVQVMLLT